MLLLQDEERRHLADVELRFLQAIRAAVPASFDKDASDDYVDRVEELLDLLDS